MRHMEKYSFSKLSSFHQCPLQYWYTYIDIATMPAHDVTVVSTWIKDDADYTAYNAAKAEAEAKQKEENYDKKYTAETRNALAEALATVVPEGLKYDEQRIIDAANAQFSAGEVSYKVETYVMGLDGQYGAAETKTVPATTGAAVSVEPEAREGFTVADNSVLSGVVDADSSLVLKVYYSRNQYKLSVDGVESDVYYGAALNIAAPAAREGFTFTGWNVEVPANMPASDLTLVSQWSENDADYTAYNAAVAAAKAKQGEENYDKMYTAETRDALAGALAIDVAGKKYSEQSVVDAATKAINDAVAALEVMTYNAIFTVDGAQYEVVPTKVGEQIVAPKDPAKEGYVFKGWDKEVGKMGVEDITFAAQFEEASGIAYTVEVYTMDVNGNYGAAETKTLYGTTDAEVTADTTAAEGFTFDESAANVVSGTVAADGSLVLKVYFARNQYKLTVDGVESMVYYGAAIEIADPAPREGYTFTGWSPAVFAHEQGENNAFAQYGSFVHSLLERWGKDELAEYELLGEYEDKFFDRVTQEFPPNKYTDLSKKYYDDGVQFLSNFEGVDAKEILGVEEHFEEPIAAADGRDSFIIQGFIDLIYIDSAGRLVVHDWKSKAKFKNPAEQKKYARQLYIYSIYVKLRYGKFPDLLRFHMFRNSKDVDIKFNIDDYYEAINWMQETVKEIRDCGEFESRPDDFYCQYLCDMRLKCCGETATK